MERKSLNMRFEKVKIMKKEKKNITFFSNYNDYNVNNNRRTASLYYNNDLQY